jgi:hypothetical protein
MAVDEVKSQQLSVISVASRNSQRTTHAVRTVAVCFVRSFAVLTIVTQFLVRRRVLCVVYFSVAVFIPANPPVN